MAERALTFGYGGFADLDLTFGEFLNANHTVMVRFMPQHPYSGPGPMLAEASGSGTYIIGQGGYREGSGAAFKVGPSTLMVKLGSAKVVYDVPGFVNQVGGPVEYRDVWQHLAVVRKDNTMRLYLNGSRLTPIEGAAELTVPGSGLPANSTRVRIGRRGGGPPIPNDMSRAFWQFYGLIDEVAVYTRALTGAEIQTAIGSNLNGSEQGLLAGWTFNSQTLPAVLNRPVTLPTASDIPDLVNSHADVPIPVYYVLVSNPRNSAEDCKKMDNRPSKVLATLPFCAGEWWTVTQGREDPGGSHNGSEAGAGFAFDFNRVNGSVTHARILAAAPGRVHYVKESEDDGAENKMSVYHAPTERAVYMHIQKGSFTKYFPGLVGLPENLPFASQPTFAAGDPLCDVGEWKAPSEVGNDHLHFSISAMWGQTWGANGINGLPGVPNRLSDYYISKDEGKNWLKVRHGIPAQGDLISRYPYSPFGTRGDAFEVAPAVASRGPNRLDVFVRGENDHLWLFKWNGQTWSRWEDLGAGRLTSSPAVVSWGPDRLDVFVRGHEGQLAHKRWTNNAGWSEWRDLGGRLTSAPAVASWGPNRLDVFVRGHEGQLAQKRWTEQDGWSDWRDLGGRLTSAPAAVSWGENRIDVFVRGHDGQLAHKRWSDKLDWGDWNNLGGRLTSAPAVASWGVGRLDVLVRGHDGGLAHKRWTPDKEWGEWESLGGRLTSGPGAVSWGENRIDVFVRGHENGLAHMWWTPERSWTSWEDLDR